MEAMREANSEGREGIRDRSFPIAWRGGPEGFGELGTPPWPGSRERRELRC